MNGPVSVCAGYRPDARCWPGLVFALLTCTALAQPAKDPFAASERAHYASLCQARKDLDSCSDAVRWSPGDPLLVARLADALVRAGRVPEAIRDYRRAQSLQPPIPGLDARISAAQAKLAGSRRARRQNPAPERIAADAPEKRYTNSDPESQSH